MGPRQGRRTMGGRWGRAVVAVAIAALPVVAGDAVPAAAAVVTMPVDGRYLVGITSQASTRAGGGILDTVVIVQVAAGRVRILRLGDAAGLVQPTTAPTGLDPGYYRLFGRRLVSWPDLAMAPDGPTVASSWLQAWRATTGQRLDGAADVDTTALARMLARYGTPLHTTDGRTLHSAAAIADELGVGLYRRVPGTDAAARAQRMREVGPVLRALANQLPRATDLLRLLAPSIADGHAWLASADQARQRALEARGQAGWIGAIPPHEVRLRFNNMSGNRADAYLRVRAQVRFTSPDTSVVTVRLHLEPALAQDASTVMRMRTDPQASSGPGAVVQTVYSVGLAVHTYTVLVNGHHIVTHSAWYDGHPTVIVPVNLVVGADVTMTYTMTGHTDIRHLIDGALPGTP